MNLVFKIVSLVSLALSFNALSAEVNLPAKDSFNLKADYFQGKEKGTRAVLMLHQCNYNRSMYQNIGEQLAKQGIHALSLDFRGFGESVNTQFNVGNFSSLAQEERVKQWQALSSHWPSDVIIAYDYLKDKISAGGSIGVIGASCGGSQAITLAEKMPVAAIGFFSSAQRDENITRYKVSLANKPTLIIAAEEDGSTFTSAQKLFSASQHLASKMLSYKGNSHGYPLYKVDKALDKTIVAWFDNQLPK